MPLVDFPDLLTWPQVQAPGARGSFVGDLYGSPALDKQDDPQQSDWIWVTTLTACPSSRRSHRPFRAPALDIENYGFNELANEWHSDHVFKHDPGAIECFLLVAFLAYNIFHVFLARNVKPAYGRVRRKFLGQTHRGRTLQ